MKHSWIIFFFKFTFLKDKTLSVYNSMQNTLSLH